MAEQLLCTLDELQHLQCIERHFEGKKLFAVRSNEKVYAYWNNCPHMSMPLNWRPDTFLDLDKTYIQCAMHGALFTIESGECVAGPCVEDRLDPLPIIERDGQLFVDI